MTGGSLGGRFSFTYGASRLQDNCLAVEVRKGRGRASSKVRGFSWEMPGEGRRRGREGKGGEWEKEGRKREEKGGESGEKER